MISVLILAAGKGTRLQSEKPKVLHEVKGKPSVFHVIDLAKTVSDDIVVIIGHKHEEVKNKIKKQYFVKFALQIPQKGTADAVMKGLPLTNDKSNAIIVLSGDAPMLKESTLKKLIKDFKENKRLVSFIGANLPNPEKYGRIILKNKIPEKVVEYADATDEEKKINLVNSGVYIFDKEFLKEEIYKITSNNNSNEFYLPDLIKKASSLKKAGLIVIEDYKEMLGFNTKEQLQFLNSL